jgi:hypothetical protein
MICPLCNRNAPLTEHHLIPKCRWRRRWVRRNFPGTSFKRSVYICEDCHVHLHQRITPTLLAKYYHTIALLREHPQVAKFSEWVAKRSPDRRVTAALLKKV